MKNQKHAGDRPVLVDQPNPVRKQNAWWRRIKLERARHRYPHVVSEGVVWYGRKTPDQRAFVWFRADELAGMVAANDQGLPKRK